MPTIRVTGVQMNVQRGKVPENREKMLSLFHQAAAEGARLVVFPECALSGYVFDSREEGLAASEEVPGPSTEAMAALCMQTGAYAVFGLLEAAGESLYNSAVLCGPEGIIGVYRKTHLPFLGVDRFTTLGPGPYLVMNTPIGRFGLLICYDLRFPEASRCLTLLGADMLILPTNWPEGADASPDFTAPARAVENRVFVVAVNRAGEEKGLPFIGRSQIIDPVGKRLAVAETRGETMISADVDPTVARRKRLIIKPEVFEIDTVGDRRPELYRALMEARLEED
jgi:5-aminopentanamidase